MSHWCPRISKWLHNLCLLNVRKSARNQNQSLTFPGYPEQYEKGYITPTLLGRKPHEKPFCAAQICYKYAAGLQRLGLLQTIKGENIKEKNLITNSMGGGGDKHGYTTSAFSGFPNWEEINT